MKYLSLCSGIEAASVAWHPLGWSPVGFSEIEPFPSAVLAHHYPDVPNLGDMTKFREWPDATVDLLVGGTPCQSFSVAGLRAGLADPRGNLALVYLAILERYRPEWMVWENVPGVLSSNGGRDFGAFLGGLGQLGYGFAYRVLDAQYVRVDGFGRAVPQRRRRVFVVGHSGDWRRAAAVLFDAASLRGDSAPRREPGQRITATLTRGAESGGKGGYAGRRQEDDVNIVAHTLKAEGFDASEDGTGRGTPLVPMAPIGFYPTNRQPEFGNYEGISPAVKVGSGGASGNPPGIATPWAVRRLTPTECERLQGFPDDYTAIPWRGKPAADGPRYKALGNSMATNCMRWLGRRIEMVEKI